MTNLQVCYKCVRKAGGNTDMETVRCPRDGKDVAIAARAGVCPLHKFSPAKKTDISISISITTPKSIVSDVNEALTRIEKVLGFESAIKTINENHNQVDWSKLSKEERRDLLKKLSQ